MSDFRHAGCCHGNCWTDGWAGRECRATNEGYQAGLAEGEKRGDDKCVVCGCEPPDHFLDAHIEFARAASQDAEAAYVRGLAEGRRAERADVARWLNPHSDGGAKIDPRSSSRTLELAAADVEQGRHINAAKTDDPHLGAAGKGGA